MRRITLGPLAPALAFALMIPALGATGASSATESEPEFVQYDGTMIVDSRNPGDVVAMTPELEAIRSELALQSATGNALTADGPAGEARFARGDALAQTAAQNGSLRASYAANVPANVRTVISGALAQWDAALATNIPIVVQVGWECFDNPGLLGIAGPNHLFTSAGLPTGDQYPVALANTLSGRDLNGGEAEINMTLNADLGTTNNCALATGEWYISTAAAVGSTQIDLYSVALHELGHGLGFLGSAYSEPSQAPTLAFPRYAYDSLVYSGSSRLVDTTNPNSQLTNGNLFFDIGGGHRSRLHAPGTFVPGSSFSHFDLSLSTQPGNLMTPALANGDVHRALDAPVLGALQRLGWNVIPRAVSPIALTVGVGAGSATVNWVPNLGAYGLPPLTYRVDILSGTGVAATTTVSGTTTSTTFNGLAENANYTAVVTPADDRGAVGGSQACFFLSQAPSAPVLVRSDGVGLVRTITWGAPSNPGSGGAISYTVQYRAIGAAWQSVGTTSGLSIATSSLPEAPHQFRVGAGNSFGLGPWAYSTIIGVSDDHIRPLPLDSQVSRLYSAYLGRAPEPAGFDFWLGQRAAGRTLVNVSANFAAAPEFVSLYGSLSNDAFVDLVYANVVGRGADPGGRAFWIDYLAQGNSRGALMVGFSESAEYVARTATVAPTSSSAGKVYRLYLAFFQREPDAPGQAFWVGRIDAGASVGSVANRFATSVEFVSNYACLSDTQFVQLVYRNVLIREADAGGLAYWTGRLAGGTLRGDVMTGFSESVEFITRSGSIS